MIRAQQTVTAESQGDFSSHRWCNFLEVTTVIRHVYQQKTKKQGLGALGVSSYTTVGFQRCVPIALVSDRDVKTYGRDEHLVFRCRL